LLSLFQAIGKTSILNNVNQQQQTMADNKPHFGKIPAVRVTLKKRHG
jgi:hypothetical protein